MTKNEPIKRDANRSLAFRARASRFELRSKECTFRSLTAAALTEIASEHHSSIGLMLLFERFASAQALLRSCVEASIRAVWLVRCATQEQLDSVQHEAGKHKGWPDLEHLIGRIEATHKAGGFIRKLLPPTSILNDLTHSGMFQVGGRIALGTRGSIPELAEMKVPEMATSYCIRVADRSLCLCLAVMHQDFGDPAQSAEMMRIYEETVSSYELGVPTIF